MNEQLGGGAGSASVTQRQRSVPVSGDVLVSRPTARACLYDIGVVPATGDRLALNYAQAIEMARETARRLGVEAWYTCDHTHFTRIQMQ
jgi:hypothetical protein